MQFIGVDHVGAKLAAKNVRMADAVSKQWIERYRAETDEVG